jgi:type 1 glutamine amidotransferase
MSIIRYDAPLQVLTVTKGHPFERDAFFAIFEGFPDIAYTSVEQPAAQAFFTPAMAAPYDAFVLYDMPGIEFRRGAPPVLHDPPAAYVRGFLELLDAGHGFVFLHHAIAGWPSWPEYAEILGGRFLYQAGRLRDRELPDSGYRHGVKHRVSAAAPEHPVLEGLEGGFEIEDELYLFRAFESDVTPLLRSDAIFSDSEFYSAARALEGKLYSSEGWSHPSGTDLVAWTHRYRGSPIVYIACGDGPTAYANDSLRRLIGNAIRWVARESGRAAATRQPAR